MVTSGGECRNCHDSDSYPTRHPLPEVTHASHFSDSSPPPSTLSVSAIVSSPGTTDPLLLISLEEGSPVMPRLSLVLSAFAIKKAIFSQSSSSLSLFFRLL